MTTTAVKLPLSTSITDPDVVKDDVQQKNLGLMSGIGLIVGLQVRCDPIIQ